MKTKAYFYLTAILVIIFSIFGFSLNTNFKVSPPAAQESKTAKPTVSATATTDNSDSAATPTQTQENFNIYYLVSNNGVNEIYLIDQNGENKKKIFTDANENLKIKSAQGITADGKNILASLGQKEAEFSGLLYFISTDGKGIKTKILDDFSSPQPAVINPRGDKIAYLTFNNAEDKYGFFINVIDTQGQNKKEIYNTKNGIFNLTWLDDHRLVFPEVKGENGSLIREIDLTDGSQKDIFELKDKTIFALAAGKEKFVFLSGLGNDTEIYTLGLDGKDFKKVTSNDLAENYPQFSPSGKNIIALQTKFTKNISGANGTIKIINLEGSNLKDLATAQTLIGIVSR